MKPYKRYSAKITYTMSDVSRHLVENYDLENDDWIAVSNVLYDERINFDMSEFDNEGKEYERYHIDIVKQSAHDIIFNDFLQITMDDVYLDYAFGAYGSFTGVIVLDIVFKTKKSLNQYKLSNPKLYQNLVESNNRMQRVGS